MNMNSNFFEMLAKNYLTERERTAKMFSFIFDILLNDISSLNEEQIKSLKKYKDEMEEDIRSCLIAKMK